MRSSANFRIVFSESQNASPLDAELGPDFIAKWPFKVIQCNPFWRPIPEPWRIPLIKSLADSADETVSVWICRKYAISKLIFEKKIYRGIQHLTVWIQTLVSCSLVCSLKLCSPKRKIYLSAIFILRSQCKIHFWSDSTGNTSHLGQKWDI